MEQKHRIDAKKKITWMLLYVLFRPAVKVNNELLQFST
jgi:hypothetical protein